MDSSVVEANVRTEGLSSTDLTPGEFAEQAIQRDGVFTICEKLPAVAEEGETVSLHFLRYQDSKGRWSLSDVDPGAR